MYSSGYEPNTGWLTSEGEAAAAAEAEAAADADAHRSFAGSFAAPEMPLFAGGGFNSQPGSPIRESSFLTDFVLPDSGVTTSKLQVPTAEHAAPRSDTAGIPPTVGTDGGLTVQQLLAIIEAKSTRSKRDRRWR